MPERIQMSRQRPWRAEYPDAVIVARPSKYGNPFRLESFKQVRGGRREWSVNVIGGIRSYIQSEQHARQIAADEYRSWLTTPQPLDPRNWPWAMIAQHAEILGQLQTLRGRDVACWCPLDQPCHGDVLLALANPALLCPECVQGKTGNCIGWTLDADDNEVVCATSRGNRSEA